MPETVIVDSLKHELNALEVHESALKDSIAQLEARHDASDPDRAKTIRDEKARLKDIRERMTHLKGIGAKRDESGATQLPDPGTEGPAASDTVATRAPARAKK